MNFINFAILFLLRLFHEPCRISLRHGLVESPHCIGRNPDAEEHLFHGIKDPFPLEVREESPLCLSLGMRDIMSPGWFFPAQLTYFRHGFWYKIR